MERDGKTLFRGAVAGFASKADAVAFCAEDEDRRQGLHCPVSAAARVETGFAIERRENR